MIAHRGQDAWRRWTGGDWRREVFRAPDLKDGKRRTVERGGVWHWKKTYIYYSNLTCCTYVTIWEKVSM
jgi:hypothetical protein